MHDGKPWGEGVLVPTQDLKSWQSPLCNGKSWSLVPVHDEKSWDLALVQARLVQMLPAATQPRLWSSDVINIHMGLSKKIPIHILE